MIIKHVLSIEKRGEKLDVLINICNDELLSHCVFIILIFFSMGNKLYFHDFPSTVTTCYW